MSNSLLKSQQNSRFIVSVILAVFGFIMILPFLWMFLSSFKTNAEIVQNTRSFFPKQWTLENYRNLFHSGFTLS